MMKNVLRVLWTIVVTIVSGILGIIGAVAGIGGARGGPRPALPRSNLPAEFSGVWRGTMTDNSPNTYRNGYSCELDLVRWRVTNGPTGPGHHGASGDLRLVLVRDGFIEVEEDITRGASIDFAVDGIFRLRLSSGGTELRAEWRSQYPDRDIYVGSGVLRRS